MLYGGWISPSCKKTRRGTRDAPLPLNVQSTRSVASGRRSYLDTGVLTADEAVLEFMRSLQQQQQQAENEGRYRDAKECANKLRELKTKEVERLQAEIQDRHTEEWVRRAVILVPPAHVTACRDSAVCVNLKMT